ncbi:MAG: peptidylprolyl isomerase [Micavibrio aeruginosavorus]|uniref:Peptidylprolyl isomerase n=1 Tax=Micavibrio aeruginosavorus TaxID=349221 RepID=A0A7T5UGW9_9BACT|nr:MAG: peptidylprolyl isomerase [Micavibrio aeruginosavorus]
MRKVFLTVLTVILLQPVGAVRVEAARTETIAAVVNSDAITATDVEERLRLVMVSSGIPNSPEIRQRLTSQVINMLVDERLMMQEAGRLGITISPQDVENGFATIAQQNNMDLAKFRAVMKQQGVPVRAMESQIRAQMAWGKVVQQKIRPQVTVNDLEVDNMIERLRANIGKGEYLVGEIFLPIDNPEQEADMRQLSLKLTREMLQGKAPFQRVATQFSQSASAKRGGDLGWVQEGQLAPEIEEVLLRMKEGDLSEPIRTLAGYYIITLRKQRMIAEENIPSRDEIMQRLGNDRLERAQRRHLLDLKAEAFIERRV